jgi:pyruvate formate lyase activating enzyme
VLGLITKIQRFSIHDGPGIRTTVFFKGCPLSCVWCQNPETVTRNPEILFFQINCVKCKKCIEVCPNHCFSWEDKIKFRSDNCNQCGLCCDNCPVGALTWSSTLRSSDDILEEVMKDKIYYDLSGGGITLSGGEPLYQIDFCQDLVSKSKALGLHVAIDTSGCVATEALFRIMPFVDLFLYDIKFIDNDLHEKYTEKSNALILANFKKLCEAKKKVSVRIPLIPRITDRKRNLLQIRNFVKHHEKEMEINYIPFNKLMVEKYNMVGRECLIKV